MQNTHKRWIILIALALFIKIFSLFPTAVEQYYSLGIYPYIAYFQRLLFGWIPFSVGDIIYVIASCIVSVKLFRFIIKLFKRQLTKTSCLQKLKKLCFVVLLVYIIFNILWGLNYNRVSMAEQFYLNRQKYSTSELASLVQLLTDSLNAIDSSYIRDNRMFAKNVVFRKAVVAYAMTSKKHSRLYYPYPSIKSSLYGTALNYTGISGYYNPFSGEAQVNTTMPGFVRPFVTCHEIGHQLGYAKEDEANFAGFLAAHTFPDPIFRYAAYFDMYMYARRELYIRDSTVMKDLRQKLRPRIKDDFVNLLYFYKKYENPLDPFITGIYEQYLKANQQPQGMKTYSEVVAMLVAYYKKQGSI